VRRARVALVSDEVFADFTFRDDPRRAGSVARDGPALAFASAVSRRAAACSAEAGLDRRDRTGPSAGRPRAPRCRSRHLPLRLDAGAGGDARAALAPEELQRPIRRRLRSNLGALRDAIGPGCPPRSSSPRALERRPARAGTRTEEERVTHLLEERDVLVHPGYFFDFPHEAFLVLSLLVPESDFAEGVARVLATSCYKLWRRISPCPGALWSGR